MHRFFFPYQSISDDKIIIDDKEQVHHIKDVLRLKPKDKIIVFDDKGNEYGCAVTKISSSIALNIQAKHPAFKRQKGPHITVACAIPKKSKFDDIVDKLTQLGVERIIPLLTERVIIRWDKPKMALQQKRWEKIALSAVQQSQRSNLPIIEPIKNIREVLSESEVFDLKLIPALIGRRRALKEILLNSKPENILVLIGPEGDFTEDELNLAERGGCVAVSLGDLVLRVETAAIAAVSFIKLYEFR